VSKGCKNPKNMSKISKNLDVVLSLDKETYKLDSKNYHPTKTKKTQIIIGASLRKQNNNIIHLQSKDFGLSKKWPTFTISREGVIYQHYDPIYYSDYMGVKEIDKKAISIVLENMGMLFYDTNKECMVNWINEECNEKFVFDRLWKNARYWETYTKEQYQSLAFICNYLIKEFDINKDALGFNVFHEESENFHGIVTRSNYDSDYSDLNPSFDFQKFLKMLNISID
jgi:hypothetical protein